MSGAIKKLEVPEEDFTADAPGGEPWNPDEFLPPAEPAPASRTAAPPFVKRST